MKHSQESNAVFGQALQGIKFPATRDELVERAEQNQASEYVLEVLRHMPNDDTYNNMPDVWANTREGKDALASKEREELAEAANSADTDATDNQKHETKASSKKETEK